MRKKLPGAVISQTVVTPDGIWHSERDFGNKPILDWEYGGMHPDYELPHARWIEFMETVIREYGDRYFAALDVHT